MNIPPCTAVYSTVVGAKLLQPPCIMPYHHHHTNTMHRCLLDCGWRIVVAANKLMDVWKEPPINSLWDIGFNLLGYRIGEFLVRLQPNFALRGLLCTRRQTE